MKSESGKSLDEDEIEDELITFEKRDKLVYGEHTKTLYLLNLAYMNKPLRDHVSAWFAKECHIEGGGVHVYDDDKDKSIKDKTQKRVTYLFDFEQLVNWSKRIHKVKS